MDVQQFLYTRGNPPPSLHPWNDDQVLVLLFGASSFFEERALFKHLRATFPKAHILGCSTAGEIHNEQVHDETISAVCIRFAKTALVSHTICVKDHHSTTDTAKALANKFDHTSLAALFVLSDGLHVNGSQLVHGLNTVLPERVIITGGLAGDGKAFERTWTLVDDQPTEHYITAVGFYGQSLEVSHGSQGGWDAFGPYRTITKATDNVLYELDERPALEVYKRYLGELAKDLPASGLLFPLSVSKGPDDPKRIVRTVLAVNEETQSLTFAGDMPVGHQAQLMKANLDKLIDGAEDAAIDTAADVQTDDQPGVLIATSCVGRRLVLGARTDEEIEATLAQLPPQTHQLGFYSYGEISPWARSRSDLHNQTMTLTWLREY